MKQAIEEGFILDVLEAYTPVDSYYKLVKKTEDDPEFDAKRAKKKLRRYVESHDHAIRLKAEIMVDHFHDQVVAAAKIGGQARAMSSRVESNGRSSISWPSRPIWSSERARIRRSSRSPENMNSVAPR
jgi:type I site-specific restriction-modification system R (restriction) subunit